MFLHLQISLGSSLFWAPHWASMGHIRQFLLVGNRFFVSASLRLQRRFPHYLCGLTPPRGFLYPRWIGRWIAEMILRLSLVGNQRQPTGHWFSCQMHVMFMVTVGRLDQRRRLVNAITFELSSPISNNFEKQKGFCSFAPILWGIVYFKRGVKIWLLYQFT